METNLYSEEEKYLKAKKKVERIKGFYRHLIVFLGFNIFLILFKMIGVIGDGASFLGAVFDMQALFTWVPWGIGLAIHGFVAFDGFALFLGKDWEERKIKKIIEKDTKNSQH
tara:strand:- start:55791 stop:56126 length:336 start_codon:yes stop_codon:yes gene_type:complete